jgi:putative membrane protein
MVKDHQKTTARTEELVDSGKVQAKLPTALDSDHQKMLDELKAKTGKEFDQSYDQIQVKAHQDAVALFEAYAKDGDNPDLKKWAATLPHLKQHLTPRKAGAISRCKSDPGKAVAGRLEASVA